MSTHSGSCLCGQVKYTFEGDPLALAVCHCLPCRKTSSTSASNNFIVPRDKLKLTGQTRSFTRKGDSGKDVTYASCTNCPTIVTVDAAALPAIWIVKAGTLEDEELLKGTKPAQEIYNRNRYPWVEPCGSAEQKQGA